MFLFAFILCANLIVRSADGVGCSPNLAGMYFPDPDDCSSFYHCPGAWDDPIKLHCLNGELFDSIQLTCKWASDVDCTAASTVSWWWTTSTSEGTTLPWSTDTMTTDDDIETTTPETSWPDCPMQGLHVIPDPRDCRSYYICHNGNSIHLQCPSGYGFDPDEKICVHDYLIGCYPENSSSTAVPVIF